MISKGAQAPDFTLLEVNGHMHVLSEYCRTSVVILMFFRGGWCPFCRLQIQAMNDALQRFGDCGATLLAITPETPQSSRNTLAEIQPLFPVLHDKGNEVARLYGLTFKLNTELQSVHDALGTALSRINGDDRQELPSPGIFIIETDGFIKWLHVDVNYTQRVEPDDIINALVGR